MMIGEHTRKTFTLGQKVWVRVIGCDIIARTIDFELVKERNASDGKETGKADCE